MKVWVEGWRFGRVLNGFIYVDCTAKRLGRGTEGDRVRVYP